MWKCSSAATRLDVQGQLRQVERYDQIVIDATSRQTNSTSSSSKTQLIVPDENMFYFSGSLNFHRNFSEDFLPIALIFKIILKII